MTEFAFLFFWLPLGYLTFLSRTNRSFCRAQEYRALVACLAMWPIIVPMRILGVIDD